MIAGPSSPVPVFSDDQIQFLAPLLAEGLRTAAPDQRIEYRVQATYKGYALESSTTETTAGSLYAYGRQLYVTLSQYRYDPTRANMKRVGNMNSITGTTGSRVPDSSGLLNRTLLFTPSDAQRSDSFDPPTRESWTDRFLAIDYQLLQHAPPTAATAAGAAEAALTPNFSSRALTKVASSRTVRPSMVVKIDCNFSETAVFSAVAVDILLVPP